MAECMVYIHEVIGSNPMPPTSFGNLDFKT